MLSFGEDCTAFLEALEFEKTTDVWKLPQPPPPDPWEYNLGQKLQDIQEEIWSLMRAHIQTLNDKRGLRSYIEKPDSFDADIQLLLSTSEYDKTRTTRRTPILSQEEELWYAGLGSLGDFSDELLAFAFDRQAATDAVGGPYYYDCISKIAKKRNSEVLEIKVATLASEGYFGQEDVTKAYRYFAMDPRQAHLYSDDNIRGMFESRLVSVQPWQEPEMRETLRIIGCSRGSKELQDAAANGECAYMTIRVWLAR
jgi:ubiquitin carboxyl-terminal hydrolase 25/28